MDEDMSEPSADPGPGQRIVVVGPDGKPQSYPLIAKEAALAMSEPLPRGPASAMSYEEGADEPVLAPPSAPKAPAPRTKQAAGRTPTKKAPVKKRPAKKSAAAAPSKKMTVKTGAAKKTPARKTSRAKAQGG